MTVTPLRTPDHFTIAAARVRAAAPNAFAELLRCAQAMAGEAAQACVLSPADQLSNKQGRAQQLSELVETLTSCTEKASVLEAKMKQKEKT